MMVDFLCSKKSLIRAVLRDQAANTFVIVAASLVPLLLTIGGAVDMSRVYLTKARLQSACDAGALAARRSMKGLNWTNATKQTANNFFNMNFPDGRYGTSGLVVEYEADNLGAVNGKASVQVPMTLMSMFDEEAANVAVGCTADLNLPNTDVMMVLDTTLSMNDPIPGDSVRRIDALNNAVMSFYDTLESAKPQGASIRYGFVPYSHTVNVGRLLHRDWIQDFAVYDSREPDGTHNQEGNPAGEERTRTVWEHLGGTREFLPDIQLPSENCPVSLPNENWSQTFTAWTAWAPSSTALPRTRSRIRTQNGTTFQIIRSNGNCFARPRLHTNWQERQTEIREQNPNAGNVSTNTQFHWIYRPIQFDMAPLKGSGPGDMPVSGGQFVAEVGNNHSNRTIRWPDGDNACIEERATRRTNEFLPPRHDMNIDMIPNPADPATQWKPYLPGLVFARTIAPNNRETETQISTNPHANNRWIFSQTEETRTRQININSTFNFFNPFGGIFPTYEGACPSPARKMDSITRGQLQSYMNSLRPQGYTYHEIGMIWGLRLISREGLFASEHSAADATGAVQRHMIFMVDGKKDTRPFTYSAWGIAGMSRRRTPINQFPTQAMEDDLSEQRTLELCTIAKNQKNISLWVIAFGVELDEMLVNCASPGRAFEARNAQELTDTFADIATQMAELRLTK